MLRELSSAAELPSGWGVRLEPGGYQLRRRDDTAAFGHAAGPQSWKRFLHPPRERLWSATRTAAGFEVSEDDDEPPRYAFLGVRPCDLRAIAIQDRVLAQPGSRYAAAARPGVHRRGELHRAGRDVLLHVHGHRPGRRRSHRL